MVVSKYFNKAKSFVADVREYNRLIEREQGMLDRGKLVLFQYGFDECFKAGEPLEGKDSTVFSRLLDEYYGKFVVQMVRARLQFYSIPVSLVDKQSRDVFLKAVAEVDSFLEEQEGHDEYASLIDREHLSALRLGSLLDAWNAVNGAGTFFKRANQVSLVSGEGDVALSFWKAVNDLKDYSYLFPDHKPPPGPKENNKQKSKPPSWKPVFVPQGTA